MGRAWKNVSRSVVAVGLIGVCFVLALAARPQPARTGSGATDAPNGAAQGSAGSSGQALAVQSGPPTPRVGTAVKFDISPPLRSITPILATAPKAEEADESGPVGDTRHDPDPAVQRTKGSGVFSGEIPGSFDFAGISNLCNCSPPDADGDVGPNHYVEMVNLHFQIFNKSGTSLYGPAANNTLWAGFGGACQTENAGDPIVLHDQLADRWLLTQFTSAGPIFYNCVALSQTSDPTGSYYRWAFSNGTNFPDYPKYGVWPDAYYLSTRDFLGSAGPFQGLTAYALNRAQMLAGNPAPQTVSFTIPATPAYNAGDGVLPSDLDGATLPPAGSPNYFVGSMDNGGPYGAPQDALNIWEFHVDWVTPASSTFTGPTVLPITAYDTVFPCSPGTRDCIPQPGTTQKLDILSYRQRPLHRLAYRNFTTHESLVTNQSVEATPGVAGIRWWEIRSPNTAPTIHQQGTYAPGDGVHRWMGSIAQDNDGNMALGYSVSNANVYPGIRYTGRLAGDPLGSMPQGEGVMEAGGDFQTASPRWGDYTSMNVDPSDDCSFWYTNEYYAGPPAGGGTDWDMRIGTFEFPGCSLPTAVRVLRLDARWRSGAVHVSWRTAAEPDALGFNLYRSAGYGPSRKVNRTLIAAKHHGAAYRFVDRRVRRGVAYQYRLQIVDRAGKRTWHSLGSAAS